MRKPIKYLSKGKMKPTLVRILILKMTPAVRKMALWPKMILVW